MPVSELALVCYHSDNDDPDFEVPESNVDGEGDDGDSEGGDDSDNESVNEGENEVDDNGANEGDNDNESANERDNDNESANEGDDELDNEGDEDRHEDADGNESEDEPDEDRDERYDFEVEEAVANWFDEGKIRRDSIPDTSDEDEDPVITRDHKIRLGTDDRFGIGRTFFSSFELKEAVLHYALKNRANLRQSRWEKDKIEFRCAGKKKNGNCCWKLYCSYDNDKQLWLLKKPVIARLLMDKLRMNPNFMPLDIQRHIKEQWKISSTIGQCQTGRLQAIKWLKNEYEQQFAHLRGYVAEIIRSNMGSTAIVDTITDGSGNHVFNRIYVCMGAMKNAFYFCRPLIGIDGTFLKHDVKGCLFTAIAHDANNQISPVAWATVQTENADNWEWFLNLLKVDLKLKDGSDYVVISDRCKGLMSAIKSVLPNAEHRPCVKHIVENLKKRHANKDLLKKMVWNLAWSYNFEAYRTNLAKMRAYSMSLYEDVMKEEPKTWCRAFFRPGSFCEDVDNNATESFNATIVKARAKSLVPMLETIRRQAMARISKRKKKIGRWEKNISKYVSEILAEEEEDALRCEVTKGTHGKFEVWVDGNSNSVNLTTEMWDCSCYKWQVTGIPCEHAYAAVMDVDKNVEDFVVPMFGTQAWKEQYETGPNPVRGQTYWMTNDYVLITAPPEPVLPGRKKEQKKKFNRIKSPLESPKKKKGKTGPKILKLGRQGRVMHCKSCGQAGHNAAGCKTLKSGLIL
ncbi:PREDICTED: uncharacterized protein LOC104779348 [Camelina sativa]|uniref:Uncharacterized protein LOC104779348 n=1 Tax=Camelina sativa TaxID=90675 RepID=A0ABM0YJL5_CAMSA|nr:PREDICTED: uncharacterized protein LOC104779348 [Camelina sativa]